MANKLGFTAKIDGESEFRQSLKNINSDMSVLTSEMRKVTAEFADNKDGIDALIAKDEILNKQVDKQTEKVNELRKALENAKEQYPENTIKINQWQTQLNTAETRLANLNGELKNNKSAMENAKSPTTEMSSDIKKFGDNAETAGSKSLKMGDIIKANLISGAIINGVKSLASSMRGMITDALDSADSIQQMADVTGMSAEAIQEWQYAGDTLGVSIDTITGAQAKLTKSMNAAKDGTGTQADAFKQLGISILDSNGNFKDAKQVMLDAFNALGNVGNETERDALSMSIFGKSAMELNPLIKAGAGELSNLTDQAKANGAVMSNETVAGLDNFGDSIQQAKQSITAIAGSILSELMPVLMPLLQTLKDNAPQIAQVLGNIALAIGNIISWIIDNKEFVIGIAAIITAISTSLAVLNTVLAIQAAIAAANPITWIILAIVAAIAVLTVAIYEIYKHWDTIKEGFLIGINFLGEVFTSIGNVIASAFNSVVNGIGDGINAIIRFFTVTIPDGANQAREGIVNGFNSAVDFIAGIPGAIFGFLGNMGNDALNWGKDMIMGLVNGIKSGIGAVGDAVKSVADKITGFLHFSVPDEGPLTTYESWMPDMTQGLANGIDKSKYKVTNSIANLARDMKSGLTGASSELNIGMNLNANTLGIGNKSSKLNLATASGQTFVIENVFKLQDGKEFYRGTATSLNEVLQELLGNR